LPQNQKSIIDCFLCSFGNSWKIISLIFVKPFSLSPKPHEPPLFYQGFALFKFKRR
jgi:hypothetical protein